MSSIDDDARIEFTVRGREYVLTEMRESEDKEHLIRLMNTPAISQSLISPPFPYTATDADAFFQHVVDESEKRTSRHNLDGSMYWAIRRADRHSFLGQIALRRNSNSSSSSVVESKVYNLGYYLDPEASGNGIMSAAINALLQIICADRIEASVVDGNIPSEKVLVNTGFTRIPDSLHYLDWPASKGGDTRRVYTYAKTLSLSLSFTSSQAASNCL